MTSPKVLRASILGTGSSLRSFHQPSVAALPDKFKLHSVLERTNRGVAVSVCGPDIKVVSTLQEVIEDPEVDVVIIATPDNTHFEYARAALNAGKHVLLEKPMTIEASEAEELNSLAKEKNCIVTVYQNRRWDSDFLTVKKLIESGKLGPLNEYVSSYDRYRPVLEGKQKPSGPKYWKEDGTQNLGIIYQLGTHTIDQAYILFGTPHSLFCRSWDSRGNGVDECFDLQMYYPPPPGSSAPLTCIIRSNNLSCLEPQLRFVIKGSSGCYTKFGHDMQTKHSASGMSYFDPQYGLEPENEWGVLVEGIATGETEGKVVSRTRVPAEKGNYLWIYENLYNVIQSGERDKLMVTPESVIEVLKIIGAARKSSKERRVVDL